ncbi:MAG: UDP-3-O-(3-hydroxymyristoyl)glucosamine N-acyltransferase [Thalassobius sp.]|nr:UDP-3-O-(3-hydroxymyristoyl)glucosamine N-acyltransferase [Thalassovita sp.]
MEFTIQELAHLLKGEVRGNESEKVHTICKIQEGKKGAITFLANPKYEKFIYDTEASAVIVSKSFEPKKEIKTSLIIVEDAYQSFSVLLEEYERLVKMQKTGIEQPSYISSSAKLGEKIYVGAFAYIGENVKIGDNCKIYPQAFIGDDVTIGDNTIIYAGAKINARTELGSYVTIQSGVVIGSEGFGFAPQPDGSYKRIPQIGNVVIKDHVDVGANTAIDCATTGSTVIEEGTKLDNLIQVAHNVKVGKNTVIAAQAGIAGSAEIGNYCMVGGQVGVVGHLKIADRTGLGPKAGIMSSIKKEGTNVLGGPAFDLKQYMKSYVVFRKLPDLLKRIEELEKSLG